VGEAEPLTATMAAAVGDALMHGGQLVRHQGGHWSYPGCPRLSHSGVPEWSVGGSTINALIDRGYAKVTERRVSTKHPDGFPISVQISVPDDSPDTPDKMSER